MSDSTRQKGVQPLDGILEEAGIDNQELVSHSTEQLTHKQVGKSRKGRQVTLNIQQKITNALNAAMEAKGDSRRFSREELFTY